MKEVQVEVQAEARAVGGHAALRDEEGRLNWAKKRAQVRCVFLKEAQEKRRGCQSGPRGPRKEPRRARRTSCGAVAGPREKGLNGWTEENRGTC